MSGGSDGKQKYCPVQHVPGKHSALNHEEENLSFAPQALRQSKRGQRETERMPGAHIPVVNPVTAGDRSTALNSCRTYEKGRKNQTRT